MDPTEQLLDALIERLGSRMREKAVTPPPSGNPAHGPGGLFGQLGMPADVINAMVMPLQGLAARMPVKLSNQISPVYTILTQQSASSGTEPEDACDDARQPGNLAICNQTWTFGRIVMDSQVVQADRAGELINRGEFIDQRLIGDPFAEMASPVNVSARDALRSLAKKKLFELMNALHFDYGELLYTGNPANTAGNTGYIEFNGLDTLINDDYQDVYTRTRCAAADSFIYNLNADVQADAANTVRVFTEVYRHQDYLAERTKLKPVQWAWVMTYSLFMKLTELWPCAYQTYRCTTAAPGSDAMVVVSGSEQEKIRASMREGRYLLIDDKRVEVILDDFAGEVVANGLATSSARLIPLTIAGGRPNLYWEYFNLAGPYGMQELVSEFDSAGHFKILGGGRYWFHSKPPTNECLQVRLGYKPRVILEAPFLAARITNVKYQMMFHERSWDINDPYYFAGGGADAMPVPYLYPPIAG
jgi:hypothetical protein